MDPFSLQRDAGSEEKIQHYSSVEERIRLLLDGRALSRDVFELRHVMRTCVSPYNMSKLNCCRRD